MPPAKRRPEKSSSKKAQKEKDGAQPASAATG
jgi:hypothetical protein